MKYLFILALLCTACKQSPKNCADFKTGTFVMEEERDGGKSYRFERTADTQSETELSTGNVTVFNIAWLDDCTYTLNYRKGYLPQGAPKLKLTIRIIKTAGEYVYYESSAEGYSGTFAGKMRKIK